MRVLFRVDASREIGIGHVMRCITLGSRLRQFGVTVEFACLELPGNIIPEIRRAGFDVRSVSQLGDVHFDWLVVDHYGLDARFESSMRATVRKILVIDDLANRPHDCDLLLDQNLYTKMENRYSGYVPERSKMLVGPDFALLRPEFAEARVRVRRQKQARRVFVFFGGSDPTNETVKALHGLTDLDHVDIAVDVLIGISNPYQGQIESLARGMPNVTLSRYTDRISELLLGADLALGGGGATSWERCCLGVPTIAIAVAANQICLSKTLGERGYQTYLGSSEEVSVASVRDSVNGALVDIDTTSAMGLRGMALVDGLGTERVIAAMEVA